MHPSPRLLAATLLVSVLALPAAGATAPLPDPLAKARAVYESDGPAAALPLLEQALADCRVSGDRRCEAIALGMVGNCHKRLGHLDEALDLLKQALARKRELGDRLEEGKALSHLGLVYWERAEYLEAIRCLEEAAAIGRALGEAKLEGSALNNLGLVYDEMGDYARSRASYRRALELYRRTGFPRGEGDTLGNLGGVSLLLGRFREAMGFYRQAFAISRRLGNRTAMSQDLGNLALCHAGLGEVNEALADFDRALALARETGLWKEEADALKGKGTLLFETGRHTDGLALVRSALARYEASGLARERVSALQEIALLHLDLGDVLAAEESLRRSLDAARAIGNTPGVQAGLGALGELERRRKRPEQAAALYREALGFARSAGDRRLETSCRTALSAVLADRGDLAAARDEASRALELARAETAKLPEAEARSALAEAELRLGEAEAALGELAAGEALLEGLGEPDVGWRLAWGRGRALEALGRDAEAVEAYRRAVARIETVRARLREERYRAGYIEERYEAYVDLVRLLLRVGREDEAFSASEKLRARSYLDLLGRDADARLAPTDRRRATELKERIRALERALDAEGRAAGSLRRPAAGVFSAELTAAEAEYSRFLSGIRGADPALAASWSLSVPPAGEICAALPRDAALVEYVVGERETVLFVLRRDGLRTFVTPVSRRDLAARVALLRDLVLRKGDEWRAPAASLAAHLVEPIRAGRGLEGVSRLYVVPHGVLHLLPFALLPTGSKGRLLVEELELASLPSAGSLVLRSPTGRPGGSVLALAPGRARLRNAPAEARVVAEANPEPRTLLLGEAATEGAFKAAAPGYRILHLATHSRWNRLNPLLSSLELEPSGGDDGALEVHEILGLPLRASLVTLSACETALGSDLLGSVPAGDDFVGLTRAFLHAGSGAVLASLWEVDDRSTPELMKAFYGRLASSNPSAALAAAQRAMLASGSPLSHPYHWAPFVLVGEAPVKEPSTNVSAVSVKGR
ncbi:MAG: CHAT domain-containing protein [Thermoanaerobaculia bacterium]